LRRWLTTYQVLALSLLHYSVTYGSSVALIWSGVVENKPFSHFREFLPICVLNTAAVCLLNLSLATNSIGVYQLSKMMTVPGTVLVSYFMYGRTYSLEVLGSLATMTAGIALSIGGRVAIDVTGAIFALVAVAVVCLASVQSGELQVRILLVSIARYCVYSSLSSNLFSPFRKSTSWIRRC
jgi:hypothetical protein